MAKHAASDSTPATAFLHRAEVSFTAHSYRHNPRAKSYGLAAAEALDLEPNLVFKTLMAEADGELVVAIIPVTMTLDLKALAEAVGAKRTHMADPQTAQRATGYVLGGISPIGQKKKHRTVLDASAESLDEVFVSGGRRGLNVGLTPGDLIAVTGAIVAPIGR